MRIKRIILLLSLLPIGCSEARRDDAQAPSDEPVTETDQPRQAAFTEQEEKKWWEWWKPDPPEPVYHSEALRKAMAANRSTQRQWWEWWKPAPPDPSDPDYITKQQAWMRYQQKKQFEEMERIRARHEKQMAEVNKNPPAGFKKSRGMLQSIKEMQ